MAYLNPQTLAELAFPVARRALGGEPTALLHLPGGASIRHYHRVQAGARSLLVMELGDPQRSEEATAAGPSVELPFLNVQRYLARADVAVPQIYDVDLARGLIYLEDLGDTTFESCVAQADEATRERYYRLAIDELVRLQHFAAAHPDPDCVAFQRQFDAGLLRWELEHFREFGLEAQGIVLPTAERTELDRQFDAITERLAALPRGFVHRDYQSRNLMVQPGPRLRVIDFQDALLGTAAYDLVGLLRDSYVALSSALVDRLVAYHAAAAGHDPHAFAALFDLQTVQRKLKDAGRFVFIDRVKKNPSFLVHIPNSLQYVGRSLGRLPELASLREILTPRLPDLADASVRL